MKKGAIFDMDGLLFDTERYFQRAWESEAAKRGYTPDPAFMQRAMGVSGPALREIIQDAYPGLDVDGYVADVVAAVRAMIAEKLPVMPGVYEILAWLREQRIPMAVASASSPENIVSHLQRAGIDGYFAKIVSSRSVPRGKPAPDVFLKAAAELELHPEDCYVFEDGVNGARGGVAAGCAVIMIPDLAAPTLDLIEHCTAILPSLNEALEHMKSGML